MNDFAVKSTFSFVKLSMNTSMKDMKPVVTQIHELEYWVNTKSLALFGDFGQSRF